MPQGLAIVIRRDGTVPFDAMEDGSSHPHKAAILAALKDAGHRLDHHDMCSHHAGHACDCEPKIHGWSPPE